MPVQDVEPLDHLGDFTTTRRILPISALAIGIGLFAAVVAAVLLQLIGLFTNLFFFQRVSPALVTPAGHHLGPLVIIVPVIGALIIGAMARYGSERIRGHGIPEAIEAILINGSRVEPKVAILKPISSAVSIGSGGPFGAEGPIIMTGGAIGSLIAQFFHLTSAERKTLLVAGAAAGMSATFAAPVASVMLAVELLLFEWKPRSVIPVALASVAAAAARRHLLGLGPIFPVPAHPIDIGAAGLAGCVVVGLLAGVLSALLTLAVYASEDFFQKLPIHWMWWPALGGLVIGIGGWFSPQALGVGYDIIGGLLQGDMPLKIIAGVLIVKSIIWAVSLGSGTSGGVLAPLLMIGGALGGLEARLLPFEGAGFWPLVSMGAILGGTMRSPLTGVVFALELTHDVNILLPLLLAVMMAWVDGAGAAALDPDGESQPARVPSEPGVRDRSTRDRFRARGRPAGRGRAAGRGAAGGDCRRDPRCRGWAGPAAAVSGRRRLAPAGRCRDATGARRLARRIASGRHIGRVAGGHHQSKTDRRARGRPAPARCVPHGGVRRHARARDQTVGQHLRRDARAPRPAQRAHANSRRRAAARAGIRRAAPGGASLRRFQVRSLSDHESGHLVIWSFGH